MAKSRYYYRHNNKQFGPVSAEELKAAGTSGGLAPDDLVWKEGQPSWIPAAKVRGLFPSPPEAALPSPAPDGPQFYGARNGKQFGPLSLDHLKSMARGGQLQADDLVWQQGTPNWVPARTVSGLWSDPQPAAAPRVRPAQAPGVEKPAPAMQPQVVDAAPTGGPQYYFSVDGRQKGPVPFGELQERAAAGKLRPEDMVWRQGTPNWVVAREVAGLFPQRPRAAEVTLAQVVADKPAQAAGVVQAVVVDDAAAPRPAPSGKKGPFPGNGQKVLDLIAQVCEPGEAFEYGITGVVNEWSVRSVFATLTNPGLNRKMVAALTNRRLFLVEKKTFSMAFDAAKEWTSYPLGEVEVASSGWLLSCTVTLTMTDGTRVKLDKVPKNAATAFEARFQELRAGRTAPDAGEADFIKGFREQMAPMVQQGNLTEDQVTDMARAAYHGYQRGVRKAVNEVVAEAINKHSSK
jgi:hypothetical protein